MFLSRGDRDHGDAFQTHPVSQASARGEAKDSDILLGHDRYLLEPTEWPPGSQASCGVAPRNQLPALQPWTTRPLTPISTAGASCGCGDPEVLSLAQSRTYWAGGLPVPLLQPWSVPVAFSSLPCAWTWGLQILTCELWVQKNKQRVLFFWAGPSTPSSCSTHIHVHMDTQAHTDT